MPPRSLPIVGNVGQRPASAAAGSRRVVGARRGSISHGVPTLQLRTQSVKLAARLDELFRKVKSRRNDTAPTHSAPDAAAERRFLLTQWIREHHICAVGLGELGDLVEGTCKEQGVLLRELAKRTRALSERLPLLYGRVVADLQEKVVSLQSQLKEERSVYHEGANTMRAAWSAAEERMASDSAMQLSAMRECENAMAVIRAKRASFASEYERHLQFRSEAESSRVERMRLEHEVGELERIVSEERSTLLRVQHEHGEEMRSRAESERVATERIAQLERDLVLARGRGQSVNGQSGGVKEEGQSQTSDQLKQEQKMKAMFDAMRNERDALRRELQLAQAELKRVKVLMQRPDCEALPTPGPNTQLRGFDIETNDKLCSGAVGAVAAVADDDDDDGGGGGVEEEVDEAERKQEAKDEDFVPLGSRGSASVAFGRSFLNSGGSPCPTPSVGFPLECKFMELVGGNAKTLKVRKRRRQGDTGGNAVDASEEIETLRQRIEEVYDAKASSDSMRDQEHRPRERFAYFVFKRLLGLNSTRDEACRAGQQLVCELASFRKQDVGVDLFARFLSEDFTLSQLSFYLLARATLDCTTFGIDFPAPKLCFARATIVTRSIVRLLCLDDESITERTGGDGERRPPKKEKKSKGACKRMPAGNRKIDGFGRAASAFLGRLYECSAPSSMADLRDVLGPRVRPTGRERHLSRDVFLLKLVREFFNCQQRRVTRITDELIRIAASGGSKKRRRMPKGVPVLEDEQMASFLRSLRPAIADASVERLRVRACCLCESPPRKGKSCIEVSALLKAMQLEGVLEKVPLEGIVSSDAWKQLYGEAGDSHEISRG